MKVILSFAFIESLPPDDSVFSLVRIVVIVAQIAALCDQHINKQHIFLFLAVIELFGLAALDRNNFLCFFVN
jgi:hypothetical protein